MNDLLNEPARKRLDGYLQEARRFLKGAGSVDPDEVTGEIESHVGMELAGIEGPVTLSQLETVLERLGSPRQWVPDEDLAWWRRAKLNLMETPQDWRLAYLTLALLATGFLFPPLLFASFLVARASVSVADTEATLGAKRWLIYPSLLMIYLPVLLLILLMPGAAAHSLRDLAGINVAELSGFQRFTGALPWGALGLGLWWCLLGRLAWTRPRMWHSLLRPFADELPPRSQFRSLAPGLGLTGLALVLLVTRDPAIEAITRLFAGS